MRRRREVERDRQAREKAERDLEVVRARWAPVRAALAELAELRSRNHVRENFDTVFGRGQQARRG